MSNGASVAVFPFPPLSSTEPIPVLKKIVNARIDVYYGLLFLLRSLVAQALHTFHSICGENMPCFLSSRRAVLGDDKANSETSAGKFLLPEL